MNKIKELFKSFNFSNNVIYTVAGIVLAISLLLLFKPFKFLGTLGNLTDITAGFFLLFALIIILLQIFLRKDNTAEKELIHDTEKSLKERKQELEKKAEDVIETVKEKAKKVKEVSDSIKTLKEEKNQLESQRKTRKKKKVDTKTAANKLKNL
jgi:flagellar biosynthesis component FlhA